MNLKLVTGPEIELFSALTDSVLELPYFSGGISAGFPSPALDFNDEHIDMNKHLVQHPAATFYGRVKGMSMKDAGIFDNDLLVIDRSIEPCDGKIAVCFIDGEFTLKRIRIKEGEIWLMPENSAYKPIRIEEGNELIIWGIVTHVVKSF